MGKKRIIAELDEDLHRRIVIHAAHKNITVRKLILQAVIERIMREENNQKPVE